MPEEHTATHIHNVVYGKCFIHLKAFLFNNPIAFVGYKRIKIFLKQYPCYKNKPNFAEIQFVFTGLDSFVFQQQLLFFYRRHFYRAKRTMYSTITLLWF